MPPRAPDFWTAGDASLPARLLEPVARTLRGLGWLRRRLARPSPLPLPAICIGNAVAGGAGKTPATIALAAFLADLGFAPQLASRGYGGRLRGPLRVDPARHTADQVGDEALLLARAAPTWIGRDRRRLAQAAAASGAGLLLFDDGLQDPHVVYDLALLVVDADQGFGNGRLLPAGPLREPVAAALARTDAVLFVGEADGALRRQCGKLPVIDARVEPRAAAAAALAGRRVVAFAGIARPDKLFRSLAGLGCELAETRAFPDHHPYTPDEIMALVEAAERHGASLVTTEKDHVRLPAEARPMVETLGIDLRFEDPTQLAPLARWLADAR
ncbi:MAG: tetraacyldisaccharide 4'-kinase [Alphaproteobacteria bacterium]|nr:tetraacyldisaccharide 4'-kinase [Alphaproteobacteria bacterium]